MIELDLLTKNIDAFPGLELTNIITLLPLFFLATVRVGSFVISAPLFGMRIEWMGEGLDEVGYDWNTKKPVIKISNKYFRPTEVDSLLGDASKARNKLNWSPKITLKELVEEMVKKDVEEAEKEKILREKGFQVISPNLSD